MRVLITGCSSGIGRDAAIHLAERGHEVIATARQPAQLDDVPAALKLPLDVADSASIAKAIAAAGRVDAVVNNAGFSLWGPAELVPAEIQDRMLATNLVGAMRLTTALLPQMRERGFGRIVQISSLAAHGGRPLLSLYAATKAGLEAWSTALCAEVAPFGVGVTVIGVGAVQSAVDDKRIVIDGADTPYASFVAETIHQMQQVRTARLPARRVSEAIAVALESAEAPRQLRVAPPNH